MPAKMTATKLKSVIKALPGKVLLECNIAGNLDLTLKEPGNIYIGHIVFKTGNISLIRCPNCALDLEPTKTKGKLRCPSCKNRFQE